MPTLTVDNFKIGVDTRRGEEVTDANRLREAINVDITNGGALRKRGGLNYMYQADSASVGLSSSGADLVTFTESGSAELTDSKTNLSAITLRPDRLSGGAYVFANSYLGFELVTFSEVGSDIRFRATVAATSDVAIPNWSAADATIVAGSRRRATASSGYDNIIFIAQGAGTTGGTEPTWDISLVGDAPPLNTVGASTTSDNGITWEAQYLFNTEIGAITTDNGVNWEAEWRTPYLPFGTATRLWFAELINGVHTAIIEDDVGRSRLFYINDRVLEGSVQLNVENTSILTSTFNDTLLSGSENVVLVNGVYSNASLGNMFWTNATSTLRIYFSMSGPLIIDAYFDITIDSPAQGTTVITRAQLGQNSYNGLRYWDVILASQPFSQSETCTVSVDYTGNSVTYPNEVIDLQCPFNKSSKTPPESPPTNPAAIKIADRIFIADEENVVFSTLEDPTDWTDPDVSVGAGFLTAGRQASGNVKAESLGDYQGKLIVGFEDRAQAWIIDQDSSLNAFDQTIDAVGSRFPRSFANISGDTFFLSSNGIRSISLLSLTNNLADVDVGTAIDSIVREEVSAVSDQFIPDSLYNAAAGQFQTYINNKAYVYTFSRTAKISAWSEYLFPNTIEYAVRHLGEAFLRDSNRGIYYFDSDKYVDTVTDAGGSTSDSDIDVDVVMAYMDFKKPAVLKHIHAFDIVCEGECQVSFLYKYYDDAGDYIEGETTPQVVTANTRPGELFPVEICATSVAARFQSTANTQALRIDAINFHYDILGNMS